MSTLESGSLSESTPYMELLSTIDSTLKETQERFNAMQEKIMRRMDAMTEQLKELEKKVDSAIEEQGLKTEISS
uniref:Heat shock factor binding protein 1 n=1 Tax=Panagrolaimus sp. JU765 TaxID=591449 RepID=A0AC34QL64_9BILA